MYISKKISEDPNISDDDYLPLIEDLNKDEKKIKEEIPNFRKEGTEINYKKKKIWDPLRQIFYKYSLINHICHKKEDISEQQLFFIVYLKPVIIRRT